jgi:hypothetical protein
MVKTLDQLNTAYHDIFYSEDNALLPLLLAIVVGSRLTTPTTWLFIVGPSSGGKGTVLSILNKVTWIRQISDLTPNTLLSGMKVVGKETSLLKDLGNNFCVTMKDFTTMISKDEAARGQILAQLREVYDGHITKATGNGQLIEWGSKSEPWKSTFIMATTEEIYSLQQETNGMGARAINYVFTPQDRKRTMRASLDNKRSAERFNKKLGALQDDVHEFIMEKIATAPYEFAPVPLDIENDIIDVADLSTQCRSSVNRNFRGEKTLALSAEFPMRMGEQLLAIAQLLMHINGGELTTVLRNAIYKTAFDSIPKQRRMVLEVITKYPKIEILGMALAMNYPPDLVRAWVEDLNMFGIVIPIRDGKREYWAITEEHRKTLVRFLGIEQVDYDLESDESGRIAQNKKAMKSASWQERQEMLDDNRFFEELK